MKRSYQSIGLHLRNKVRQRNKVMRKGGPGMLLPFLLPSDSASAPELPTVLCWDRAARFTTSVVHRNHCDKGPGRNPPFSVENKWQLLVMMTLCFESQFVSPFFIVRHQLA